MTEADKLLQMIDEGVEHDLYALIRNPQVPKWLKDMMLTAAQEPDHGATAYWLRHLADSLDGQKTATGNPSSPAPASVHKPIPQHLQPTASGNPPQSPTGAQPSQAPNSLPNVTGGGAQAADDNSDGMKELDQLDPQGKTAAAQQNTSSAPLNPRVNDPLTRNAQTVRQIKDSPQTPQFIKQIIDLGKGSNPEEIFTWLEWLAKTARSKDVSISQFNGLLADDRIPAWAKQALQLAQEDQLPNDETANELNMLAYAYARLVSNQKLAKLGMPLKQNDAMKQQLNKIITPAQGATPKAPRAPKPRKAAPAVVQPVAPDEEPDRLDPDLVHGGGTNIHFDDGDEDE